MGSPVSSPRVVAGRYQLGATVGAGATAKVFSAVDLSDSTPVVVKMLPAAFGRSGGFVRRFTDDVGAAAELRHPNLVRVLDFGLEQVGERSYPFVVSEQLVGGTLRGILDRGRQLTASQALVVGLDACKALDHAHRRGLVHGSVTPSNLLFGADRRVRIADFGLSRLLAEVAWADVGRLDIDVARYASPEQAQGLELEPASDVYTLCLSLVESVTGQVPFAADTVVTTLTARVDKLMPVSADLGALASVLERAGRPAAADRTTAAEFGRALVQAAEKMPRPAPIPVVGIGLFGDVTGSVPQVGAPGAGERPARSEQPPDPAPPRPAVGRVFVPNVPPPLEDDAVAEATDGPLAATAGVAAAVAVAGAVVADAVAIEPVTEEPVVDEPVTEEPVVDEPLEAEPDGADEAGEDPPGVGLPPIVSSDADLRLRDDTVDTDDLDLTSPVPLTALGGMSFIEVDPAPESDEDASGSPDSPDDQADDAPPFEILTLDDTGAVLDPGLATVAAAEAVVDDPTAPTGGLRVDAAPRRASTVETVEGDEDAAEIDRRSVLSYVLVALGIVIAAVIGVIGYRALSTPEYTVPNLIGVPEAEATNQVAANGWDVQVRTQRDDTQDQGDVIRTEPPAGERLEKGADFVLIVSEGPTLATLPEIAGVPVDEARSALVAAGLSVREADRVADESVEAGRVLSWSVPAQPGLVAGGQVPKGTTIEVVVSAGPAPRQVPNLVGKTVQEAVETLTPLGLTLGPATEEFSDDVPAGQIISSTPAAGASATRETAITVVVSRGPDLVAVPNLLGLTKADMEAALAAVGLEVGATTGPVDGVVAGTDIAPGTRVERGTKISVIFGTS